MIGMLITRTPSGFIW